MKEACHQSDADFVLLYVPDVIELKKKALALARRFWLATTRYDRLLRLSNPPLAYL